MTRWSRGSPPFPVLHVAIVASVASVMLVAPTAHAVQTDCIQEGGETLCTTPQPDVFTYGLCDEAAAYGARIAAWCIVQGGSYVFYGGGPACFNQTIFPDEGNLAELSVKFAEQLHTSTCHVDSDTGWGFSYSSNNCGGGSASYQYGYLTFDMRSFAISCDNGSTETVRASKYRPIACPTGYVQKVSPRGVECARPVEPCETCPGAAGRDSDSASDAAGSGKIGVGNPITPASGIKVQQAVDYRGGALSLTRQYHSFGFSEPFTSVNGAHTENRLGATWRTGFDSRIVPVTASSYAMAALSKPSGQLQFFDLSGKEILNYRGGTTSTLVHTADGYFVNAPEGTQFFDAAGRLKSITSRSGETVTLMYSDGTAGAGGALAVDRNGNPTTLAVPANWLLAVSDAYGRSIAFSYDAGGRIVVMTDPAGERTLYTYDAKANLSSVKYPDGSVAKYGYNEAPTSTNWPSAKHALTSVTDSLGAVFAKYTYGSDGRALSTQHAGGAGLVSLAYGTGTTSVTDPMGTTRTFAFAQAGGIARFKSASSGGGSGYGTGIKDRTFDAKGNVTSQTNFNDTKTCLAYDPTTNLETVRVEGLGAGVDCSTVVGSGSSLPAGARKKTVEWHPRWAVPVRISEPNRITTFVYNGDTVASGTASCAPAGALIADGSASGQPIGVQCEETTQGTSDSTGAGGISATPTGAAHTWKWTYDVRGRVLTQDGPRTDVSDVTVYAYYADDDAVATRRGELASITDALGHATTYTSYDAHGNALTTVDPNGVTTTLTYDVRQRLISRTIAGATTEYDYNAAGLLTRITLPGGAFQDFAYDDAHRLVESMDALGNRGVYAYDAADHVLSTTVYDPSNQVVFKERREYDAQSRLSKTFDADDNAAVRTYDLVGNLASLTDASGRVWSATYDALDRLTATVVDAASESQRAYDANDNLVSFSDGRGLQTTYTYDAFGTVLDLTSPDTGKSSFEYDAAGNLLKKTDALGRVTTFEYDALNRTTVITANDGSKAEFGYDQGTNGIGRLTSVKDASGSRALSYYARGLLVREDRTISLAKGPLVRSTIYTYDAADRLSTIKYPSGTVVTYTRDSLGRVTDVSATVGGTATSVVSNISYDAANQLRNATGADGAALDWGWDKSGRLSSYALGAGTRTVTRDGSGLLTGIGDASGALYSFAYDGHGRVKSGSGPMGSFAYEFDGAGNQTKRDIAGDVTTFTVEATSNRLTSASGAKSATYTYDATGNMLGDGARTMSYDALGRLVEVKVGAARVRYVIDIHGNRVGRLVD